jgi:hypothetical protein
MIHDNLIQANSLVIVRSAGAVGDGVEIVIEKAACRVVAAEPESGRRVVKIMGF